MKSDEEPAHGDEPAYGDKEPAHGDEEPAHDNGESAHGDKEPTHGDKEPTHGNCGEMSQESAPIEDLSATSINISDQCRDFALILFIRWLGFKIVIDNIDKNLRPSYQRCDNKTILQYVCMPGSNKLFLFLI